eukprot:GEMP01010500.1.p1 GENE.GEMP01010500.1~~GEMP01010500.1.p1  ORF type:complete len:828 (+),score=167.29 GEMP01010500.1:55-2484(+)
MWNVCLLFLLAYAVADHYATLGVSATASINEIKLAYRALAKLLHPDKNSGQDAERKFIALKDAYELLIDKEKRLKYDARPRYDGPRRSWIDWENIEARPQNSIAHYSEVGKLLSNHEFVLIHVFYEEKHFFGGWMSLLPTNFALTHVNVLHVEDLLLEKLKITQYPCLIVLSTHFGRHGRAEIVPRRKEKHLVQVIEHRAAQQLLDYEKIIVDVPFNRDAVRNFLDVHLPSDNGCIRLLAVHPSRLITLWALARRFPEICVGQVFSSIGFPELDLERNSALLSHPLGHSTKVALNNKALTKGVQRFLDRWIHEAKLSLLAEGRHIILQSTLLGMEDLKSCITTFEDFCQIASSVAKCWWLRGYIALPNTSSTCSHRVVLVTNGTMAIYPSCDFDTRPLLRWVQTASHSAPVDLLFLPPEVPSVKHCISAHTAHPACGLNASYPHRHTPCRGGKCVGNDAGSVLSLLYAAVLQHISLVGQKWVAAAVAALCCVIVLVYALQSPWKLCTGATAQCICWALSSADKRSLQGDVAMAFRARLAPSLQDTPHVWGIVVRLKVTTTRGCSRCEVVAVTTNGVLGGWNRRQPELWRVRRGDRITRIDAITDPQHIVTALQQPPGSTGSVLTVVRPQCHEFSDAVRVMFTQVLPMNAKFELFDACDGSNTRETAAHRRLIDLHVPPTTGAENARATFLEWRASRHWRMVRARVLCERGAPPRAWGFNWCINACGLVEVVAVCVEDGFGVARGDVVVSCNHERRITAIVEELERCISVVLVVERWERRNDDKFSIEIVNVTNIYNAHLEEAVPRKVWV